MDNNTYKLKLQKLKGTWVTYFIIAGIGLFFLNNILGLGVLLIGIALMIVVKKNPENTSALYYNMAFNLYNKGDKTKSKQALLAAINYNKLNKDAYFFLGCIYFDEKDYTNALTYLKKGGVDKIEDPSLVYVLGRCYYHEENYEKAIHYLEMISYDNMKELERERLFTLGKAYSEIDDYVKGAEALEKANISMDELKGDSLEYCYYLAVAYSNIDKDIEAKELIKKVYEVDRHYKYIDIYAKQIGIA
ncbi:tetratricopeptide repeat protein [Clostridium sp. LP20]|uniref:tetratricopeptide repeat protein n=1 Tax=Clostridium sp. LP20 TaxID=3418665 RepID=UPI003EE7EB1A